MPPPSDNGTGGVGATLPSWPRLTRPEDLIVWSGQLHDRLKYTQLWVLDNDVLKPANPNWTLPGGGGSSVSIGATPPTTPAAGDMWWRSTDGVLFVYYDDGNSKQWVPATPTAGITGPRGSLWWVGSGPPGTIANSQPGDMYLNTTNGDVWQL